MISQGRRRHKKSRHLRLNFSQTQPRPQTALDDIAMLDRSETSPDGSSMINGIESAPDKTGMEKGMPGLRRVSPLNIGHASLDRSSNGKKSSNTGRESDDKPALVSATVASGESTTLGIDEGELVGKGKGMVRSRGRRRCG